MPFIAIVRLIRASTAFLVSTTTRSPRPICPSFWQRLISRIVNKPTTDLKYTLGIFNQEPNGLDTLQGCHEIKQCTEKRSKAANTFTNSTNFSWSPSKPTTKESLEDEPLRPLTKQLEELSLKTEGQRNDEDCESATNKKDSKALRTKDANARKKRTAVSTQDASSNQLNDETCAQPEVKNQEKEKKCSRTRTATKSHKTLPPSAENDNLPKTDSPPDCVQEESQEVEVISANEKGTESKTATTERSSLRKGSTSAPVVHPRTRRVKAQETVITTESAPNPTLVTHATPLLKFCSDPEGRIAPSQFSTWSTSLEKHFNIAKIAEASYGEVYRLSLKTHVQGFTKSDESVLKIIALKPPPPAPARNGRVDKRQLARTAMMSAVENVVSEVQLLQRMTSIPGFTNFREVRVVQGRPSKVFSEAWKAFNKSRPKGDKSIFPDPSRKGSYDAEQLWAVIEMQDAGTDLENVNIVDVWGVWDVFWGVAVALAKGEEGARFEHRDLHLGNICVKLPATNTPTSDYSIKNTTSKIGYTGLETTIIDYTLSRAEMSSATKRSLEDEHVAYLDLEEDPELFEGDGDEEYQYDMYRYMRAAMYLSNPLADLSSHWDEALASGRTWRGFHPQTNVVWLHFVLVKLLGSVIWPSQDPKFSVERLVESSDTLQSSCRAVWLERTLLELRELLSLEDFRESGVNSARDLIGLSLARGWLDECHVIGAPSAECSLASIDD